ncbi:MAG TPA: TonB-dependent receptor [Pyrinomonadaceae bacterium]|nr:TonB-dependent receptor [Pyrinomonadaceae bacterium]
MSHRTARLATSAAIVFIFSTIFQAQSSTSIRGTVSDEQGGKVIGAEVRLSSREGLQLQTTTTAEGVFEFSNLPAGAYLIEVKAKGFSLFTTEETRLKSGENRSVRLQLSVAAVNASVVVTSTGTPQRADEVAKVVSTIDSQQIELKQELSLTEAVRGLPGVRVQQQGSPGALASLRLRGLRSFDTAFLLDGLRVRDAADINGSAVSLIADLVPVSIDRLELLLCSGSSIYGTNAIGGVVNIVPAAASGGLRFEASTEAGSLSTFRQRLRIAGGGKRFGLTVGTNRTDVRKGFDGNDQYGNTAFGGRFEFTPSSSVVVSANVYGTIANARLNDAPFALTAAFGVSVPYPKAVAGVNYQPDFNNPDQGRRNRLLVGSVKLTQQVNDSLAYAIAYQRVSSSRRNYNGSRIDPQFVAFYPFGDFEFSNVNRGITDTLDARLHMRLGRTNLATVGFEFEAESFFQESIPSFSAFNRTTDKQRTFALFAQDQISLFDDRLQVSVGVRTQSYRLRAADRPSFLESVETKRSFTGDGAIAYFVRSTRTKLRAHVGNGFRAPSLFERFGAGSFPGIGLTRFGDPTLKAEQSISVDAGIDQRFARDRVVLGATYFYTRLQRVIVFQNFVVDPLGLGRFSGYTNQPGGVSRGLETFVETTPARGTEIRGSYSFTNSDRSVLGQELQPEYVVPRHSLGFTVTQRLGSLALNVDLNRTGSYIAPVFENSFPFRMAELEFSGYTKVDLFATYERRISERVTASIFGGADNLFNQKYFENGFRVPGIVGRGGVTFKF